MSLKRRQFAIPGLMPEEKIRLKRQRRIVQGETSRVYLGELADEKGINRFEWFMDLQGVVGEGSVIGDVAWITQVDKDVHLDIPADAPLPVGTHTVRLVRTQPDIKVWDFELTVSRSRIL
jgi:hypothetical protein